MARYTDSVCRLCRREGIKLFLKTDRCVTPKCAIERRAYVPGQHGQGRKKFSEYGVQLREKQKVRRIYGVLEKQFRKYFAIADRKKGVTGENLMRILEMRLDNVVYRLGFAGSRVSARQLVRHKFFTINGQKVDIPSYQIRQGDVIGLAKGKEEKQTIKDALGKREDRTLPSWLSFDTSSNQGSVQSLAVREDITIPIDEQLIVELYSR
ncbi:MAG: 30S ribosomal protein S4 [Nitrospinales bacterium]